MTHGSLFSGFGAADLAAEWMGWRNAFWCEIDPFPRRVLRYWFPDQIGYEDITKTDFTKWRGKIDVLTGGFPCQPFSVAGRRKGADDDRYLWPEMLRAIREIQPRWVVGENVAGILTMVQPGREIEVEHQASMFETVDKETLLEREYVVETVCRDLEREGYSVQPALIPACAVGAPHRRDRVFFIAHRADARIEAVQCGGEDGVPAAGNAADTDLDRQWNGKNQQVSVSECESTPDDSTCSQDGVASNPCGERRYDGCHNREGRHVRDDWKRDIPEDKPKRDGRECRSGAKHEPLDNPFRVGCHPFDNDDGRVEEREQERLFVPADCPQDRWRHFPTQPPVCRGNDGLPFDVERLTLPFAKWRAGAVKGYGNAIVPQVMYEIFKAIGYAENKQLT